MYSSNGEIVYKSLNFYCDCWIEVCRHLIKVANYMFYRDSLLNYQFYSAVISFTVKNWKS